MQYFLLGVETADVKSHIEWKSDETVERYIAQANTCKRNSAASTLVRACSVKGEMRRVADELKQKMNPLNVGVDIGVLSTP